MTWDLRYPASEVFDGLVLWGRGTQGPLAVPGKYQAKLTVGATSRQIEFVLQKDPRLTASDEAYNKQFSFLTGIRDKLSETHRAIKRIRDVRNQINALIKRIGKGGEHADLVRQGEAIISRLTEIEETLYQTKSQSRQDPLNFPIRLNNRLSALVGVVSSADGIPTKQAVVVHNLVVDLIDAQLEKLSKVLGKEISDFNSAVAEASVPAIFVEK